MVAKFATNASTGGQICKYMVMCVFIMIRCTKLVSPETSGSQPCGGRLGHWCCHRPSRPCRCKAGVQGELMNSGQEKVCQVSDREDADMGVHLAASHRLISVDLKQLLFPSSFETWCHFKLLSLYISYRCPLFLAKRPHRFINGVVITF